MNKVRGLVSKKKRRYMRDGFDLDLTYVTARVIAMGFPSERMEGLYRNPMGEVKEFLESRHKDHYFVYNLCSERRYDPAHFHGRVECHEFDDHNAPSLEAVVAFCESVEGWLGRHPDNVAVVHCKAGKGRTGVMISAYLQHCGMWHTSEDALEFYASARTHNRKGVTIPSQRRYVHYFEQINTLGPHPPRNLSLRRVSLTPHPHRQFSRPRLRILSTCKRVEIYTSDAVISDKEGLHFDVPDLACSGDIKVEVLRSKRLSAPKVVLGAWFNTGFVAGAYCIFPRSQLDTAYKPKNDRKYSDHFALELFFAGFGAEINPREQGEIRHAAVFGKYDVALHGRRSTIGAAREWRRQHALAVAWVAAVAWQWQWQWQWLQWRSDRHAHHKHRDCRQHRHWQCARQWQWPAWHWQWLSWQWHWLDWQWL
eukprot:TRINITY_DN953_c1_g1_i3.p1 TRINITY_DN953_c1_g1~~TRINITY_DN953_c1_g1_i3.p1  ORF type:complete len:424 (-),score=51.71 TRINITY_DN953_c1_g1_i3:548-1819(-)